MNDFRTLKIAYQTQSYEDRSEKIKIFITESREIQDNESYQKDRMRSENDKFWRESISK